MKKVFKYWYVITLLWGIIVLPGCSHKPSDSQDVDEEGEMICSCPPVICLQPYGNFSKKEATLVKKELEKLIADIFHLDLDYDVLPALPLSDSLMNKAKTRYRADKIIHAIAPKANYHSIYIGLTHQDISCSVRGKEDWGVQGLSLIPGKACVASTYRVKNKRDFPLVVCHEFIHTYFNYNHCPKDDPHCLMQDAKGRPDYKGKRGLCEYCKSKLVYNVKK